MNEQRKINYLAKLLSILFIIICIGLYFLTNDKPEWYCKLINNLVPEMLGPVLAVLFIFYIFINRGINLFVPDTPIAYTHILSVASIKPEKFGIKITSPSEGDRVSKPTEVKGTYEYIPENTRLSIYFVNNSQTYCWINVSPVIIDHHSKTWKSKIYIGSDTDINIEYYIVIALEDIATEPWFTFYKEVSAETKNWRPLKYPLPKTVNEVKKIRVYRK